MSFFAIIALLATIIAIIYLITHLRPLTENEIGQLAQKRRNKSIRSYFTFDNKEYVVDKIFKKNMRADGSFYEITEQLFQFPSLAAGLLKYKKHEWIITAFEKNNNIELIWLNKGFDKNSVSLSLPLSNIIENANQHNYSSVLTFHNHPNTNPNHYNCTSPSNLDLETAKQQGTILNSHDINLLEFVCERGRHYEYYRSLSPAFFPISQFLKEVRAENSVSGTKNLLLHLENTFN